MVVRQFIWVQNANYQTQECFLLSLSRAPCLLYALWFCLIFAVTYLLSLSLSLSLCVLIFGLFCLNSANLYSQFYTVLKNKVTTNISANIVAFLFFLGSEKKILLQHITSAESLSLAAPKGLKLLKEVHI